ncbi:MAG: SRPBCC family protein [Pyrinomonadaceae bacterium]
MRYLKESFIKAKPEVVFGFHELPDAFERLVPPWENVRIIQKAEISKIGSKAILEQTLFGLFRQKWVAEHTVYEPPHLFVDVQVSGPFKVWMHHHRFVEFEGGTFLRDEIEFDPGFSIIGELGAKLLILPKIEKMFAYRHEVTREWCEGQS